MFKSVFVFLLLCLNGQVSMIRKYHNNTLQTNPRHHEEEPQNNNNHKTPGRQTSKATSSLFPIKMIAKLESTHSNAQQTKEQTQSPTMGAIVNNECTTTEMPPLNRTDSSLSHCGRKCILPVPNLRPGFCCC